jgi:predicted DNA binding CopG/RHH family protein
MAKKRRGRPSTGHGKPITMRFREALLRAIDKHAAEEGITRSEWLRKAAEKAAKKRE